MRRIAINHHGGASGVTGSCHELFTEEGSLLIDCGLFQGAEAAGPDPSDQPGFGFDVQRVRALVLTHCHLDHVGRLPHLFAAGFSGPIFCSEATAALLPLTIEDALRVGFTRDRALIRLFLDHLGGRLRPVRYGEWTNVPDTRLRLRLKPAGHILGSAYAEIHSPVSSIEGRRGTRVVFSGDLGAPYSPLLPSPRPPYRADLLVLESTYGDRLHEGRRSRRERLKAIIERCLRDRGVVLIPAFSIGRTQELLYELEHTIHRSGADGPWGGLEVVVDSPLAADFTARYRQLCRFWDAEARRRLHAGRHPLSFEQLTTIDSHQEHLQTVDYLARTARPTVVIAASGMCSGGRVVNYLKALLGDRRTDILFVGYQAGGTPGRAIQRYGPTGGWVELDGERFDIRAGVHTIGGYSAHADQKNLVDFAARIRTGPREIRLVHGDDDARQALAAELKMRLPGVDVSLPSANGRQ